jgi:muramoyltetrapeptide carboxypeptidase
VPLAPGARVALVAPAGPVDPVSLSLAQERLQSLGFLPVLGRHAASRLGYLAGSDQERREDLVWALMEADVQAVWALRGGYGTGRLLGALPWEEIARSPRLFVGLSDLTFLHVALNQRGIPSLHGPMPAGTGWTPAAEAALRRALFCPGAPPPWREAGTVRTVVEGRAQGVLLGGNLAILAASLGTPHALQARGSLLFLEDVDEPPYRLERYLDQLEASGACQGVRGVLLGRFFRCPPAPDGTPAEEVVAARVARWGVPVVAGVPTGHGPDCPLPLWLGVLAELDAGTGSLTYLEAPQPCKENGKG